MCDASAVTRFKSVFCFYLGVRITMKKKPADSFSPMLNVIHVSPEIDIVYL